MSRKSRVLLVAAFLPLVAAAETICALGTTAKSYNAYADQRPSPDAMQLASRVNAALAPLCTPNCPIIAIFRNDTAANAMLIATNEQAKIVYAPKFFTSVYESYGDGAIMAVIAHELGHALEETAPAAWMKRSFAPELRADAWAGCVLAKAGLTQKGLEEALTAASKYPAPAHPGWSERLPAWRLGFTQCGGDASRFEKGTGGKRP